jgi:hypothetical protein
MFSQQKVRPPDPAEGHRSGFRLSSILLRMLSYFTIWRRGRGSTPFGGDQ